jgi:hypothetical protein
MEPPAVPPLWTRALLAVVILGGLYLRWLHVADGRWAHVDEAMLGYQVYERNYFTLAVYLGFQQVAPVGYTWLLKTLAILLGSYSEWVLRIPALVAGVGGLVLSAWLFPRVLRPWGALTATGVVALTPLLVSYSWEMKPYSLEATTHLLLLALALAPPGEGWRRPLPRALLAAAIAPWFAMPSVFILPAVLAEAWRQDEERASARVHRAKKILGLSAALSIIWVLLLGRSFRGHLYGFWSVSLGPWSEGLGAMGEWFLSRLSGTFEFVLWLGPAWPLAAAPAALGLVYLARHHPRALRIVGSTLGLWILAATLRLYPAPASVNFVWNRLSVHVIPLVALLIGAGVSMLERPWLRWLAPVLGAAVLYATWLRVPASFETDPELPRAVAYLHEHFQDQDLVGLTHARWLTWQYLVASGRVQGGPADRWIMAGRYVGTEPDAPHDFPPGTRRFWWYSQYKAGHDVARVEEQLAGRFVLAPEQPPVKELELYVLRDPTR